MSAVKVTALVRRRRKRDDSIFTRSLSPEEQEMMPAARAMEGLEEEIAVLRVKLAKAVEKYPNDLPLMKVGMDALVRAVAAEYRMSAKAERDLSDSMAAVIRSIGDQLISPDR